MFLSLLAVATGSWAAPVAELGHVEGHVLLRLRNTKKLDVVTEGRAMSWGEVLVTGDASRFELRPSAGGGLWRVGRRAVFSLKEGGACLLAGTALVQVPKNATWRVESIRSVAALPAGSWLVQAVDNLGLKILCLDDESEPVLAWGDPLSPAKAAVAAVRLRPGQLVFLQPDGKEFSPMATIYLAETLSTSRLVNGFPEPVPGMERLVNQAIAQQARIDKLSNAVIVGASKAGGFQIAVPNPPKPETGASSAKSP
ncbi:MAG TPA: hypothetical protein VL357_04460 [Rariglobus sp.]|nr:hypothetical protein [Rariglobus sp.]